MRLYHFNAANYGLQNIRRRRLKIARINELNDPFEFLGVASRSPTIRKQYAGLKNGLSDFMGMLCFSANWRSPAQWSHYADHHRGLCLGFEINPAASELHKVDYVQNRLKAEPSALETFGPSALKHMQDILTTKFLHWKYEQEYRLFSKLTEADSTGLYFFEFENGLSLKEVIVGHRSVVTRAELNEALGSLRKSVKCTKARLAFRSFDVVSQRNSALWQ